MNILPNKSINNVNRVNRVNQIIYYIDNYHFNDLHWIYIIYISLYFILYKIVTKSCKSNVNQ